MELGPKRPSFLWFWGPNSIMVLCMDPLGSLCLEATNACTNKHAMYM